MTVILFLSAMSSGCVGVYEEYYYPNECVYTESGEIDRDLLLLSDKTELTMGGDVERDAKKLMENGYIQLGYSSFEAFDHRSNRKDYALLQGRKLGARFVYFYKKYLTSVDQKRPIPLIQPGGTISIPTVNETKNRFSFVATYWARIRNPHLGTFVRDLNDEERVELERNRGVVVRIVIKNTIAYVNDILPGDVLIRINGDTIGGCESYGKLVKKYRKREVNLEILRKGKTVKKKIRLDY